MIKDFHRYDLSVDKCKANACGIKLNIALPNRLPTARPVNRVMNTLYDGPEISGIIDTPINEQQLTNVTIRVAGPQIMAGEGFMVINAFVGLGALLICCSVSAIVSNIAPDGNDDDASGQIKLGDCPMGQKDRVRSSKSPKGL